MDLQRSEAAAELDLLPRRDALIAEHQHVMIQVRAMDTREAGGRDRLRQVEPDHLGAEAAAE